ncbi:MAG: fibronectin type III domain-containing protein [Acetobacteraceae bacterium]
MRFRGVGSPQIVQLALAALVCASLAACGGSGPSTGSSAATVPSTSSSSVSTAGPTSSPAADNKSVTLSWSPPTQNSDGTSLTDLAGYTLHYGTASEDYTGSLEITTATQTSYVVSDSNFPPGTYYFAISAYNAQQISSSLSGEITVTVD